MCWTSYELALSSLARVLAPLSSYWICRSEQNDTGADFLWEFPFPLPISIAPTELEAS
jgi:hypothetical protein